MTAVVDTTTAAEADAGDVVDDQVVHLTCCKPNRSLCRMRLDGPDLPYDTPLSCFDCSDLDERDATCGAPFCRLRQWLRQHLGRAR